MNKKVEEYLSDIQNFSDCIVAGESKKDKALAEYWKKVKEISEMQNRYSSKINEIKNVTVSARLSDIVRHLADEWGTSVDNVNVSNFTNCRCVFTTVKDFNDVVNSKLEHGGVKISYYINRTDLNVRDRAQNSVTIEQKVNMEEPQADGKAFRDHIIIQSQPTSSRYSTMDLGLDDYDDVLISKKLKDLIFVSQENSSVQVTQLLFAKAMWAAVQDYEAENKKEELAD